MLFCQKCKTSPYIKQTTFDSNFYITYCCNCGIFSASIDKFVKLFLQMKNEADEVFYIKCNDIKNHNNIEYCWDCKVFICLLCSEIHINHYRSPLNHLTFDEEEYDQFGEDLSQSYDKIHTDLLWTKNDLMRNVSNEIKKLQAYQRKIEQAYKWNSQINDHLLSLITNLLEQYKTSKNQYLYYINLLNLGNLNLVYKWEDLTEIKKNEKEKIKEARENYDFPGYKETINDIIRSDQTINRNITEEYLNFINKCKHSFILEKGNSELTNLKYLRTQSLKTCGFYMFNEDGLEDIFDPHEPDSEKEINIIRTEVVDETTLSIYSSYHNKIIFVNTTNQSCEFEIETIVEDFHTYNAYKIKNPFLAKIKDGKCLLFDGESLNIISIYTDDYSLKKFPNVKDYVWTAISLKNGKIVIITEETLEIYNSNYKKEFETEYEGSMYTTIFECGHQHLVVVDDNMIDFWDTETYKKKNSYNFSYNHSDTIQQMGKTKILHLKKSLNYYSYRLYLIIYNCCPFQSETIIQLYDGFIKYCNCFYIENTILLALNSIIYSMSLNTFEKTPILIIDELYRICSIVALPNRRLAIIGDDRIIYYKY